MPSMNSKYSMAILRVRGEDIEQAKKDGADLVAIEQEKTRRAFSEAGLGEIQFVPRGKPGYVIGEDHPSSQTFNIYPASIQIGEEEYESR